jgi:hypothetical protein
MKKLYIFFVILAGALNLAAQHGGNFTMSYSMGFPVSNLKDYNSSTSFRGISLEFNKTIKPNMVDVSLETGWNVFYDREDSKVYTEETASITGVQYRYTNSVPIILGGKWYKTSKNENMKPFLGVGLGTLFTSRSTDFGLYRINTEAWQFCIRPELGFRFDTPGGAGFLIGGKYYGAFDSDDLDAQSYFTINVGVVFPSGN